MPAPYRIEIQGGNVWLVVDGTGNRLGNPIAQRDFRYRLQRTTSDPESAPTGISFYGVAEDNIPYKDNTFAAANTKTRIFALADLLDDTGAAFGTFEDLFAYLDENAVFSSALGSRADGYGYYTGGSTFIPQGTLGGVTIPIISNETQLPFDISTYYNTSTGRIQAGNENDLILIEFTFDVINSVALGSFNVYVDESAAGNGTGLIKPEFRYSEVSAGFTTSHIYMIQEIADGDFLTNGGIFYFDAISGDLTVFNANATISLIKKSI